MTTPGRQGKVLMMMPITKAIASGTTGQPLQGRLILTLLTLLLATSVPFTRADVVLPSLQTNLVSYYDFEHPSPGNAGVEDDLGFSGTSIQLVNGGAAMRTNDGAYPGSLTSMETRQVNPGTTGNDDWKAGIYDDNGVATLSAFSSATGITVMGWVKPTGTNPSLNSETANPDDYYNAVGLFGVLSGTSDGHGVRALLEVINVSGTLRLVALGRRLDAGSSYTLAATNDWQALLPDNVWTHLTATFDFDGGEMALFRNGEPIGANYTSGGDPWNVTGGAEPDVTSASNPAGIKIGGSYPQNTQEKNPFNGQLDDLMFFDKTLSGLEVQMQYANFVSPPPLHLSISQNGTQVSIFWPDPHNGVTLESTTKLGTIGWTTVQDTSVTNGETISVTLPIVNEPQFFRLKQP